uniref:ARAD1D36454p n=1 Tax=Blastobotrys adeninivorans TaxID=409370 RepID=A0A060TC25_BLAAD
MADYREVLYGLLTNLERNALDSERNEPLWRAEGEANSSGIRTRMHSQETGSDSENDGSPSGSAPVAVPASNRTRGSIASNSSRDSTSPGRTGERLIRDRSVRNNFSRWPVRVPQDYPDEDEDEEEDQDDIDYDDNDEDYEDDDDDEDAVDNFLVSTEDGERPLHSQVSQHLQGVVDYLRRNGENYHLGYGAASESESENDNENEIDASYVFNMVGTYNRIVAELTGGRGAPTVVREVPVPKTGSDEEDEDEEKGLSYEDYESMLYEEADKPNNSAEEDDLGPQDTHEDSEDEGLPKRSDAIYMRKLWHNAKFMTGFSVGDAILYQMSFPKIEPYGGEWHPFKLRDFFIAIESSCDTFEVSDQDRVEYASVHLYRDAQKWYEEEFSEATKLPEWDEFQTRLIQEFIPQNRRKVLYKDFCLGPYFHLMKYRQPGQLYHPPCSKTTTTGPKDYEPSDDSDEDEDDVVEII